MGEGGKIQHQETLYMNGCDPYDAKKSEPKKDNPMWTYYGEALAGYSENGLHYIPSMCPGMRRHPENSSGFLNNAAFERDNRGFAYSNDNGFHWESASEHDAWLAVAEEVLNGVKL